MMRVSPVGWTFASLEETVQCAGESAAVTHKESRGFCYGCGHLARAHWRIDSQYILKMFGYDYDLDLTCDSIRPAYRLNESSQGTMSEAIIAFLDSTDF